MIINIEAMYEWYEIPKGIRKKILDSVFCSKCFVTTIVDYDITLAEGGSVLLEGKCKKCGGDVARVVDEKQKL